jgi:hypothetical protein
MALSLPIEELKIKIMKKTTNIFIIVAVAMMALVSCSSYEEDLNTKQVFNYEVRSNDWIEITDQDGLNRYYTYGFDLKNFYPGSTFKHRAVLAYISFGDYEQPLPYIRHYENSNGWLWTRTVDFEYSAKEINFFVTSSDFAVDKPEKMYFRVVFIW